MVNICIKPMMASNGADFNLDMSVHNTNWLLGMVFIQLQVM